MTKEANIKQEAASTDDEFRQSLPLSESLLCIQRELKAPKNQKNSFGGYMYRSCEDILEALKPLLMQYYCTMTIADEIQAVGHPNGSSLRYYVRAMAKLTKGDQSIDVSALARETENKKGMDAAQITGAASSYARKYALGGLFLIDDNRDPDATNTHDQEEKQSTKKPQEKPPANLKRLQEDGRGWIASFESPEKAMERIKKTYSLDEVGEALIVDIWHAERSEEQGE